MKKLIAVLLLFWGVICSAASPSALGSLGLAALQEQIDSDAKVVGIYRAGLRNIVSYVGQRSDVYVVAESGKPRLLTEAEKVDIRSTWQRLSEYYLALESMRLNYQDAYRLKNAAKSEVVGLSYAVFTTEYAQALKLIELFERNPAVATILNEPMPDLGLPKNSYAKFKFRYLNVQIATEFAAQSAVFTSSGKAPAGLADAIAEDSKAIWQAGLGKGHQMTLQNGLAILKSGGHGAWFPVQAGVSEWMGDTKVLRVERSLISHEQIKALLARMQPGDIILERREWYLSNIGLPGFWPHGALYVGTPQERRAYFNDQETREWVKKQGQLDGDFEALLAKTYPAAYRASQTEDHGVPPRIIEAVSEGVVFSTFEHSTYADAVAILRPRLAKLEKASAILRSFQYQGRPYDFDFDFQTDAALVCTELVYKSYEPKVPLHGIQFPLVSVLGRLAMPANLIARQFDEEYGKPAQQLDFVAFLDGRERKNRAVEADVAAFRNSWRRPKWHIFAQEQSAGGQ